MPDKELWTTTDIYDDLWRGGRLFTKKDLDDLMAYCASLGASRHQWNLDNMWNMYDADGPFDYDLLGEAVEAAHRHGMRFSVIFKTFEAALSNGVAVFPHTAPRPEGVPMLDEDMGLIHVVRPFLVEHPEMRMARRPEDSVDPGGRIAAIRLVKNDSAPNPFAPGDLSILTSDRNGGFRPYDGPMDMSDTLEWRRLFPYRNIPSRIVTLGGLQLPENTRYVMVRCAGEAGEFMNAIEHIVELVNENGELVPLTPSRQKIGAEKMHQRLSDMVQLGISPMAQRPEIRDFIKDRDTFIKHCADMYDFRSGWEDIDLFETRTVVAARGKMRHSTALLNPVYPEVREHWLESVRFGIERGVDAVSMQVAAHNRSYEPWSYGFNPPTLEQMDDPSNDAEAARINGQAYTQFLREAAELLHANGREIGVQVNGLIFHFADNSPNSMPLPHNMDLQWETWIREFADYAEFVSSLKLRPENIRQITDRIGLATREAGIPLAYRSVSGARSMEFDGPFPALAREMDWVQSRRHITAYNLYETASFTRIGENGALEGSPDMAALVNEHWA